jgi:hypothetical protein
LVRKYFPHCADLVRSLRLRRGGAVQQLLDVDVLIDALIEREGGTAK